MLIAGRYEKVRVLGEGGMGTVYLVEDTLEDHKQLALKTQVLSDESVRLVGALKHEFRTLSRLSHPNVARVYDFGTLEAEGESQRFYFTSEYIDGTNLHQAMADASWESVYDLVAQLLRALSYIHSHAIVHRDIKPANVLVSTEGELKLVDFGVVSHTRFVFAGHTLVGTPAYAAPEIIRGDSPGPASDLYATGVSLFQAVTSKLPFEDRTLREMLAAHLSRVPPEPATLRPDIPEPFAQFLVRLLAKEPSARFATAGRALAALSNIAGHKYALDTAETRVGYIQSGEFVGRTREIERLRQRARRLDANEPPAVGITGAFGVGKSRLLRELRVSQQLAEVPVFATEARASADPIEPWRQLVRQVQAEIADEALEDRYRDELAALEGHSGREGVGVAGTAAFLAEAAERRPFILQIDELGRADTVTLDVVESLLQLLSRTAKRPPLLVVVTVDDRSTRGIDRLRSWSERALAELLALEPLSTQVAGRLAASMLGTDELPSRTRTRLVEASEGNPFVLGELLKELATSGKIERKPSGEVHIKEFAKPKITKQLEEALRLRVASLSSGARRVLDALGVLNRPADATALTAMGIEDSEETGEALGELHRAGVIGRLTDGRVALTPPLLAEVLEADLADEDRRRLHRTAGELLEEISGNEAAAELSLHFGRAGDLEREARYAREAGMRLKRLYANEDALRFLARAAELSNALDPELELARAEIELLLGARDQATERIASLVEGHVDDPQVATGVHLLSARIAQDAGRADDARAAQEHARQIAPPGSAAHAHALAESAQLLLDQGRTDASIELATEALGTLAPGEELPAFPHEVAELHLVLGLAQLAAGQLDAAELQVEAARRMFIGCNDRRGEVRSVHGLGRIQYQRGRLDAADESFRLAAEGFLQVADLQGRANAQMNLGVLLHASSDYVGAIAAYHDALEILQAGGTAREQALVGCNLGNLYSLLGSLELARETTEESLVRAGEADLKQIEGYDRLVLGAVERSAGRLDDAEKHFRSSRKILEDAGRKPEACIAAAKLADVLRDGHRWDEALALLSEAEATARELGAPAVLARALTSRGRLEGARPGGDPAAARELLEEARELAQAEGDSELIGEIDHGLALLLERDGDVEGAVRLLARIAEQRDQMRASLPPEYARHFYDDFERRSARDDLVRLRGTEARAVPETSTETTTSSPAFREIPSLVITPTPGSDPTMELTPTSAVWTSAAVKRLLEIVGDLNAEHDLEVLLVKILDAAIALTGAERGFLIQMEDDEMSIRAARNLDRADLPTDRFPVSRTIAEEVARSGDPVLSNDAVHDAQLRAGVSIQALGTQSILAVPLRTKGRSMGAVWLEHRFKMGAFGDRERELAQTLADQAGTALENARLLHLATERARELEEAQAEVDALNKKLQAQVEETEEELANVKEILSHTQSEFATRYDYTSIIGRSEALQKVLRMLDRITDSDVNVLVEGESGTGKELVARALHANGPRAKAAFVSENCGAVPENLLESTLFGHMKGSFTGASSDRKGLFEVADGGTLFLDEVGEMPAAMQVKLLRALQEGEIRRIGSTETIHVDVRVIAATNRDLAEEVREGRFREDLYYRLNVVRIPLPPLRHRKEDIPLLVEHFLEKLTGEMGSAGPSQISKSALGQLIRYDWPGNIRELENALKKAYVLCDGDTIGSSDLGEMGGMQRASARKKSVPDDERERMLQALEEHDGKVAKAAEAIGMPVRTFYYKLSKMGMARRGPRRS